MSCEQMEAQQAPVKPARLFALELSYGWTVNMPLQDTLSWSCGIANGPKWAPWYAPRYLGPEFIRRHPIRLPISHQSSARPALEMFKRQDYFLHHDPVRREIADVHVWGLVENGGVSLSRCCSRGLETTCESHLRVCAVPLQTLLP